MGVELFGLDEFDRMLSGVEQKCAGAREKFLKAQAELLKGSAQSKTPVDTGGLRLGWARSAPENGMISVYNNTEYAAHVEYGHRIAHIDADGKKVYATNDKGATRIVKGAKMLRTATIEQRAAFRQGAQKMLEDLFP